jgi:ankyrin repeat protein
LGTGKGGSDVSHSLQDRERFFDAIGRGEHAVVRELLALQPDLAQSFDARCFGTTPLARAAGSNDRAMIDLLLEAGADPNQTNDWWAGGFGPLDDCTPATADYLLARGATLTPHAAARLGRIDDLRQLLEREPQCVHARGGDGKLPLHFAGTPAAADLLLAHGAQLEAIDVDHESTAAQWLASEPHPTAAHLVQRGAATDVFMAALIGDAALLQRLAAAEPDAVHARVTRARYPTSPKAAGHIYLFTIGEGCTLLHAAANANRAASIRWLAAAGVDVNARGGYDDATPLHAAAWRDAADAAAALLDVGAAIDAPSGPMHHNEPLGWAIVSGAIRVVELLLSRGAAVRPHHRADARAGTIGQFREFNRSRPIEAWYKIARLVDR